MRCAECQYCHVTNPTHIQHTRGRPNFVFGAKKDYFFYFSVFYFRTKNNFTLSVFFIFRSRKSDFRPLKAPKMVQLQLREIYVKPNATLRPARSVALSTLLRQLINSHVCFTFILFLVFAHVEQKQKLKHKFLSGRALC